jgi:TolB protein
MNQAFASNSFLFKPLRRVGLGLLLAVASSLSIAQLTVEIGGTGSQQYPIAQLGFVGDAVADELSAIVNNDLSKSGLFRLIPAAAGSAKTDYTQTPNTTALRAAGADAAVWGTLQKVGAAYELRLRIQDTVRNAAIDNAVVTVRSDVRFAGHQIADRIYEKITGQKGFFTSRLAYVTHLGRDAFELRVSDWDGQHPQVALRSKEPLMSLSFSPDNTRLAYVSFESRKAVIYVHDLVTGARKVVANYRSSNSAPSFSPSGSSIAAALSRDGLAQIYSMDSTGDNVRRLTQSSAIDTEPAYSADGSNIYFVSDRGGQPQIYRMSTSGANAQRVTFNGDYNVSPAVSPDGRLLAYIARRNGRFVTAVMDLNSQQETIVSDGSADESPSFVSNSQFVIYASKVKGRGVLTLASVDGKVRSILSLPNADIREPAFSAPLK